MGKPKPTRAQKREAAKQARKQKLTPKQEQQLLQNLAAKDARRDMKAESFTSERECPPHGPPTESYHGIWVKISCGKCGLYLGQRRR